MRNFNTTAVNLRADARRPRPAGRGDRSRRRSSCRRSPQALRGFAIDAVPTVRRLDAVVRRPGAGNDLIELTALQPRLARIAVGPVRRNGESRAGRPAGVARRAGRLAARARLLPPLPDRSRRSRGWFDDFGHSGYRRRQRRHRPDLHHLQPVHRRRRHPQHLRPAAHSRGGRAGRLSLNKLQRCPGANERDPGDGSTPFTDNGNLDCDPSQVPTGP